MICLVLLQLWEMFDDIMQISAATIRPCTTTAKSVQSSLATGERDLHR